MARKDKKSVPFPSPALTARLKRRVARWGGDLCGVCIRVCPFGRPRA